MRRNQRVPLGRRQEEALAVVGDRVRCRHHPGDEARRHPVAGVVGGAGGLRHAGEEQRLAPVHRDVARRDRPEQRPVDRGAGQSQQLADDVVGSGVAVERHPHPAGAEGRLERRHPPGVVVVVMVVVADVARVPVLDDLGEGTLPQEVLAAQEEQQVRLEVPRGRGGERRGVARVEQPRGKLLGRDQQPRPCASATRAKIASGPSASIASTIGWCEPDGS